MATPSKAIIDYYDACEIDYKMFWDLDNSHAMHAGFWDEKTRTLRDALRRENEILAEMAEIKKEDVVLDAGCGIGGSSLFLAREVGCTTVGITLSEKQVQTASRLAEQHGLSSFCSFEVMDFSKMSFPNASFDVVWGVESFCHAVCKKSVLQEAFRVLKPGGRLIIADGFQLKRAPTLHEHLAMCRWLRGWGCEELVSAEIFGSYITEVGFEEPCFRDMTLHVLPSSKRLFYLSIPAFILSKAGEWLKLRSKMQTENIAAAYAQHQTLKKRVWHYGIFTAVKKAD